MSTNHFPRHLFLATLCAAALAAVGCSSLHDEHYNWCHGQDCAIAQVVPPQPAAATAAPAAPASRRVNLSADTLFVFDRSSAADMLPQGKSELDALARALREQEMQAQSLVITGHTDRLGDAAYNDNLALQRANTVRDYLRAAGVLVPMEVRSMGEREPVTQDCKGTDRTPGLIACLQPDRRVVVDILGQTK